MRGGKLIRLGLSQDLSRRIEHVGVDLGEVTLRIRADLVVNIPLLADKVAALQYEPCIFALSYWSIQTFNR